MKDKYDALAWALERVLPGTKVTIEDTFLVKPFEPVYRLEDWAWDEQQEADYRTRHQQ